MEYQKLGVAEFKTNNNLPYIGLIATEKIYGNEVLIKVPESLMITPKTAFFGVLHSMFVENPRFFSANYHNYWRYNLLWAYLIYENSLGQNSQLYYILQTYPKGADYLDLWNLKDLELLEDKQLL